MALKIDSIVIDAIRFLESYEMSPYKKGDTSFDTVAKEARKSTNAHNHELFLYPCSSSLIAQGDFPYPLLPGCLGHFDVNRLWTLIL